MPNLYKSAFIIHIPHKKSELFYILPTMSLECVPGQSSQQHTSKDKCFCPVPIIDFSKLHQHSETRSTVIYDIREACMSFGCFQIINHGIDPEILDGAIKAALDFFDLSNEEKETFASGDISEPVRYGASPKDSISKARDVLKLYAHPLSDWIHLWPSTPKNYRERMGNFVIEARRVALQLIDAILESLNLDQPYLRAQMHNGMQVAATNFYPKSSDQNLEVGLDSHSDYGFITVLLQSCPGLQVIDREMKVWHDIPQLPKVLHVHIGDYMEVLSNGRYESLIHRAILNPESRRVSIASIHNLSMDENVSTPKGLIDENNPKRYKESSFRDFLNYLSAPGLNNKRYIEGLKIKGN